MGNIVVPQHTCHAIGCERRVSRIMFMCAYHWHGLPKVMKREVWAHYRVGQETDKRISRAYAEAAKKAIRFAAGRDGYRVEGNEPELTLYDIHVSEPEEETAE